MNSLIIIGIIIVSFILAFIKYKNTCYGYDYDKDEIFPRKKSPWPWKFIEIWNPFINFLLGGLIGYYFILVRWNPISNGEDIETTDLILLFIFAMCLTGWFTHLLKNVTEGINAILGRFFPEKK